jgi:hypothetical protein
MGANTSLEIADAEGICASHRRVGLCGNEATAREAQALAILGRTYRR